MGTLESIKKINRADLIEYYKKYLTPEGTRLSLVGDVKNYDLQECADHIMSGWSGKPIEDIKYPEIEPVFYKEINYPMARDQVVLCYAGLSVRRTDPDYDKLLLFDQIFAGGVLNSMGSRLFDIRTRTGLFYTISGTLISGVDVEPGLIMIRTIVSNDRLAEAEKAIEEVIAHATDTITETEFSQAKQAIINTLVDNFSSNYKTAATFLFKDKYNLPDDYFDHRANQILALEVEEVREAVKKYLDLSKMIKVRVGRV
jgi:zinc protease